MPVKSTEPTSAPESGCVLMLLAGLVVFILTSFFIWAGWNLFLTPRFDLAPLTFWESIGAGMLVGVARTVFGGIRRA